MNRLSLNDSKSQRTSQRKLLQESAYIQKVQREELSDSFQSGARKRNSEQIKISEGILK